MSLHEQWEKTSAQAYLGMTVPGFPNFAIVYGPNTNLGHNSIILMIEAQSAYINRLIAAVCKNSDKNPAVSGAYLSIQPRADASHTWNAKVQIELSQSTLASPECSSWYRATDGRITTNWSKNVVEYQKQVSAINWMVFELQGPGSKELLSQGKTSWNRVVEESRVWEQLFALGSALGLIVVAATLGWSHFLSFA